MEGSAVTDGGPLVINPYAGRLKFIAFDARAAIVGPCLKSVAHRKTRVLDDQFATVERRRACAAHRVDVFPMFVGLFHRLPTAAAGTGFALGILPE